RSHHYTYMLALALLCVASLLIVLVWCFFFFFNATSTTDIYTLSLHDALPILITRFFSSRDVMIASLISVFAMAALIGAIFLLDRSEEHTSELQSRFDLVCRLLLEKKKKRVSTEMRNHDGPPTNSTP